jgi:predicted RNase H-like HicB family nuclease
MRSNIQTYVEEKLAEAEFVYDESVGQWAGWIESLPGVWTQGPSVEWARKDLGEIIEEWVTLGFIRIPSPKATYSKGGVCCAR